MSQTRDRVRRLLEDELGECCESDVDNRLSTLETLAAETEPAVASDSDVLGTLGNETRLRLVRYLDATDRDLCVCELETLADVSESAVSHALSDLTDAGLVTREKRGKWRYYDTTDRASAILSTLDETRAGEDTTQGTGTTLGFVCVQNAGRSQLSAAFAEREAGERGLDGVDIVTGGTRPAEAVHPEVVDSMQELGIDLSDREPREVSTAELDSCDVVVTMGCSTLDLDADTDVRDWALPDPDGEPPERVREIREQVRERVESLFAELFDDEGADR